MTRNVLVIGLGLIGGSIALALQKAPHTKVFGYDFHEQTRELASTLKVVHEVVEDPGRSSCRRCGHYYFWYTC